MRLFRPNHLKRGFTLLELIVVIVILGLLAAIAIPTFMNVITKTKDERSLAEMHSSNRAVVALAALNNDGDRRLQLQSWLGNPEASAMTSGNFAAGESSLKSIAWLDGDPTSITDTNALAIALAAPSTEYGYYSVDVPAAGVDAQIGMAMRSLYSEHCVFAVYDSTSGALSGTAIKDWKADGPIEDPNVCSGANARLNVESGGGNAGSLVATNDILEVEVGASGTVDVLANDFSPTGADLTLASIGTAQNGTISNDGGSVTYQPTPEFSGSDSVTYEVTDGTATATGTLNITVGHNDTCAAVDVVPANWYPLETSADTECAAPNGPSVGPNTPVTTIPAINVPEGDPLPNTGGRELVGTELGSMGALTSFPHSDLSYPHYVFGTSSTGGIFWVKDTGTLGQTPGGCATAGEEQYASCSSGWLYNPGTFSNPAAAITGQGPGHGSVEAAFEYDTLFVADSSGIWSANVDAFTSASDPTLIASGIPGSISSMTGYACFENGVKVAGNCLWVASSDYYPAANYITQVNIETGVISTLTLPSVVGLQQLSFIQSISYAGEAQLLVGDSKGNLQRFSTAGVPIGGLAAHNMPENNAYTIAENKFFIGEIGTSVKVSNPIPAATTEVATSETTVVSATNNQDGTWTFAWDPKDLSGAEYYIDLGNASDPIAYSSLWDIDITSGSVVVDVSGFQNYNPETYEFTPFSTAESFQFTLGAYAGNIVAAFTVPSLDAVNGVPMDYVRTSMAAKTYSPTNYATSSSTDSVVATALHGHGVPGQLYMLTDSNCLRKLTGSSYSTLWCAEASFNVKESSGTGEMADGTFTDQGYYLIQHRPIDGAVSYRLDAVQDGTGATATGTVAANPNPFDRGNTYFGSSHMVSGTIERKICVKTESRTADRGEITASFSDYMDCGYGPQSYNGEDLSWQLKINTEKGWDGNAQISIYGEEFTSAQFTLLYSDDVDRDTWVASFDDFPQVGSFILDLQGGTFLDDVIYDPARGYYSTWLSYTYEGNVYAYDPEASDPIDIVFPDRESPWRIKETAIMGDGSEVHVSSNVLPALSGGAS